MKPPAPLTPEQERDRLKILKQRVKDGRPRLTDAEWRQLFVLEKKLEYRGWHYRHERYLNKKGEDDGES